MESEIKVLLKENKDLRILYNEFKKGNQMLEERMMKLESENLHFRQIYDTTRNEQKIMGDFWGGVCSISEFLLYSLNIMVNEVVFRNPVDEIGFYCNFLTLIAKFDKFHMIPIEFDRYILSIVNHNPSLMPIVATALLIEPTFKSKFEHTLIYKKLAQMADSDQCIFVSKEKCK